MSNLNESSIRINEVEHAVLLVLAGALQSNEKITYTEINIALTKIIQHNYTKQLEQKNK